MVVSVVVSIVSAVGAGDVSSIFGAGLDLLVPCSWVFFAGSPSGRLGFVSWGSRCLFLLCCFGQGCLTCWSVLRALFSFRLSLWVVAFRVLGAHGTPSGRLDSVSWGSL